MLRTDEYLSYDAVGLAELVRSGAISAGELLEVALARAEAVNPHINAIVVPMTEIARARAGESLQGPFAGVPFLLKDISDDYAGVASTWGSRARRDFVSPTTSEAVRRFLAAGLVIFGKTSTPELALKGVTESERFGATRNPWDLQRTPGGSSGGAGAAVAAGILPMAAATDGGGSIRIPAAYCGLFGLRPSRGRVPSGPEGEVWEGCSSQLVLSHSVRDAATALDVLAGADCGAPFVVAPPQRPYREELQRPAERLRIGFSVEHPLGHAMDPECLRAVERTVRLLQSLGHDVEPAAPEIDGHRLAHCYLTMYFGQVAAEVTLIRAQTGAAESEFELDTRALALIGRSISAEVYTRTRRSWNVFARALGRFFQTYDLYLTPTTAQPPARIGELHTPLWQRLLLQLPLWLNWGAPVVGSGVPEKVAEVSLSRTPFTQLSNLTGTPSMSVPLHWGEDGLPYGSQFIAPFGAEDRLLRLASQLEQAAPWRARRAPLAGAG